MKNIILAVLLLAMLTMPAQAELQRVNTIFDINSNDLVSQTTTFYFDEPLNGSDINYTLDSRASDIEVFDEKTALNYESIDSNGAHVLRIFLERPTSFLTIRYASGGVVFRNEQIMHFLTEFSFNSIVNMTMQVKLPEGSVIYENYFKPNGAEISSDGTRIILTWREHDVENIFFSVKFTDPGSNNFWMIIVIVIIVVSIYMYNRLRKKTNEAFLHGFREDEQKTIRLLEQKKTILQSDLQKEFKFSRAKATRIVYILEHKGLVRKQKHGRTNRIFWLRK